MTSGGGEAAALTAAAAAALCEAAARGSGGEGMGGAAAQAKALRQRAERLAADNASAYADALRALGEVDAATGGGRDEQLGAVLARAADVPLAIAELAADVAALAAELAGDADSAIRGDVVSAAILAEGAARAAAHLVSINLSATAAGPRVRAARRSSERATDAARRVESTPL